MQTESETGRTHINHLNSLVIYIFAIALSITLQLVLIPYHDIITDEGFLAYSGYRMSLGQLPHRDFITSYVGGLFFYFSFLFKLFTPGLLTLRYSLVPIGILNTLFCVFIVTRLLNTRYALIAMFLSVVFSPILYPYPYPTWIVSVITCGSILITMKTIHKKSFKWMLIQGMLTGLCMLIKQTTGAFLLFSIVITRIMLSRQYRPGMITRVVLFALMGSFVTALTWHHFSLEIILIFICPFVPFFLLPFKDEHLRSSLSQWKQFILFMKNDLIPLTAGIFIISAPLFIYYLHKGIFTMMLNGIFTIPMKIIENLYIPLIRPTLGDLTVLIPATGLLVVWIIHYLKKREFLKSLIPVVILISLIAGIISWFAKSHDNPLIELSISAQHIFLLSPLFIMVLYFFFRIFPENSGWDDADSVPVQAVHLLYFYSIMFALLLYPIYYGSYLIQFACIIIPLLLYLLNHVLNVYLNDETPSLKRTGKIFLLSVPVGVAFLIFVSVFNLAVDVNSLFMEGKISPGNRQPCSIKGIQGLKLRQQECLQLGQLVSYIESRTRKEEKIYVFSDDQELYLMTGRNSPTRYDYFSTNLVAPEDCGHIIHNLEHYQVRYIIANPARGTENLAEMQSYILKNYEPVSQFGKYTVFRKKRF